MQRGADHIAGGLYQGSFPPLDTPLPFDAVVLCAYELQPPTARVYARYVIHAPLNDGAEITRGEQRTALRAAGDVAAILKNGGKVLSTCAQGRNRSGLVSALSLCALGWRADDAIAAVRRARAQALSNGAFVDFIRQACAS